ncbi:MAG: 3-hydroxyacyl-CoA dehydrogenase family protein [bacterium]|nr:3-hydroxyacyl-CoA dehydrogenase family protein [bacterium]
MNPWGLLGEASARTNWEKFLLSKEIPFLAIDRAPIKELKSISLVLIVDNDFRSKYTKKISLFEDHINPDAPIVANLIAASAARLTKYLKRPNRVVGIAICPPLGKYTIEFATTEITEEKMIATALQELKRLELPIETIGDRCGGVFPRTIAMLINEATFALQEGLASAEELDLAMKFGVNYPKGLLEWGDEIGAKFILDVIEGIRTETRDSRYRASPYLIRHAAMNLPLINS